MLMKRILQDFWRWIEKTPEEYSIKELNEFDFCKQTEKNFPSFEKLKSFAFELVKDNILSSDELYDLLTILALDNQKRDVFEFILKYSSEEQIKKTIQIGTTHLQTEARHQLLALIYLRGMDSMQEDLSFFTKDPSSRVKNRASHALEFLSKKQDFYIRKKLDFFWSWLGKSKEEYAQNGVDQRIIYEDDFPFFEELIDYSRDIVDFDILSTCVIECLLTVMALDHEAECVLDYIEMHSSEKQFNILIKMGINCSYYQTRWQIAELLYRRKPSKYLEKLTFLSHDSNFVVSSRAKNLLNNLNN